LSAFCGAQMAPAKKKPLRSSGLAWMPENAP